MSEVISSFKSLRAGSQVFTLLMFLCVILHTMWSGKSMQLLYILPFGMLCLSAISMMFVKSMLQCVCWWVWWPERNIASIGFDCVILHYMWSGKSLQLLCILPFGICCVYAIRMMFVQIPLPVCILV